MNYNSPMFPLQQSDELVFQISSTPHQQYTIPQDTQLAFPSLGCSDLSIKMDKSRLGKSSATSNNNYEISNNNNKTKVIHRDAERQRRQEMTTLYGSLRSLLPLEYVKGKRSISNHMNEAANYIRNLKKNIQELGDKRDHLRKLSNSSSVHDIAGGILHSCSLICVTVRPCWVGVEVVISSGLRIGELPMSRVLQVLVQEGFIILSCISTNANERSIHTIQSEVRNLANVDLPGLQQKLMDLLGSSN